MEKIAKKTVLCGAGFVLCRVQGRQKHAGEDGDDRNRYEELYKGEFLPVIGC